MKRLLVLIILTALCSCRKTTETSPKYNHYQTGHEAR